MEISQILDYNYRVRRRWSDFFERFPWEEFIKNREASFHSMRGILLHILKLDFNLAYNPYCAYSEAYTCPLPPPENWLKVSVRAGEKAFVPP